jgi:hypothetical protein
MSKNEVEIEFLQRLNILFSQNLEETFISDSPYEISAAFFPSTEDGES